MSEIKIIVNYRLIGVTKVTKEPNKISDSSKSSSVEKKEKGERKYQLTKSGQKFPCLKAVLLFFENFF